MPTKTKPVDLEYGREIVVRVRVRPSNYESSRVARGSAIDSWVREIQRANPDWTQFEVIGWSDVPRGK